MKNTLLALAATLALAPAAQAAIFDVTTSFNPAINIVNPGLQAKAVVLQNSGPQDYTGSTSTTNDLNVGDSESLDFFIVRTLQTVAAADDFIAKAFGLVFDVAGYGSVTVTGTTYAETSNGSTYGVIDFDGLASLNLGNGTKLLFALADAKFNRGPEGFFTPGKANGAVIGATIKLAEVPVPASLPLGLSALGLLALIARRRKAAVV